MMPPMDRKVGILGGMGPEATAAFFREVIRRTPAERDQDHLPIVVVNDPTIPDRTEHLLRGGPSPLPALIEAARTLEAAGAGLIAIPCNTAHAYHSEIAAVVAVPVLHIVEETADEARRLLGPGAGVGILSTRATLQICLYQPLLAERGLDTVLPPDSVQRLVSESIAILKGQSGWDGAAARLATAAAHFQEKGCRALILACTELGLVEIGTPLPLLDSLDILAAATVREARLERAAPATGTDGAPDASGF